MSYEEIVDDILQERKINMDGPVVRMASTGLRALLTYAVQRGESNARQQRAPRRLPRRTAAQIGGEKTLTLTDLMDLDNRRGRVFNLLSDGEWHSRTELVAIGGQEGTKRARELRDWFILAKRRKEGTRSYEYRLYQLPHENYGSELNVSQLPMATDEDMDE